MRRWLVWGSVVLILLASAWWLWLAGRPRFETGRWHKVGASQIRLERVLIGTTVQAGGFRQPPEWLNYIMNRVPVLWNWWDRRQEHRLEAPPGLQLVYVEASGYAAREVLESMDLRVDVGYGTYGTRSRSLNRPDTGPAVMEFVVEFPGDAEVLALELKVGDEWVRFPAR